MDEIVPRGASYAGGGVKRNNQVLIMPLFLLKNFSKAV